MVVECTQKLYNQDSDGDQKGKEPRVERRTRERKKTTTGRTPELKYHLHESDLRRIEIELELTFARQ
jgi:hypothetical protein